MFFKTLEIHGFKSFADKTVLNFDTKTTAVVGSNGNGKSNISDALRWVMGEPFHPDSPSFVEYSLL